jgi:outer membrane protein
MKAKNILTILLVSIATTLSAQSDTFPAQLRELIQKAMDNYPKLKEGDEYIKSSQTQHDLAKAGYMPTIDGDATYRYGKPTPSISFPGFGSFQFLPANNYDFHVAAQLPIWDFGRTQADVKKTLLQIQTSRDNLENVKLALAYQVAELYCAIVFYNKSITVQNEQIAMLQENEKIIADRVKNGDALKYDLLSTQVRTSSANNLLIDLQNSRKKDYEYLDLLAAQQGDDYITLSEISFNTQADDNISSDKSYDILILNDQLKTSEMDIKSARNNWLPKLTGKAQIGYQDGYAGTTADGSFIPIEKLLLTGSVGVGLTIPIYGADRPNYRIKIAQINVEAAKYNIATTKMNLDKNILQARSDLDATRAKLKNYELQVDQAKEALDLANLRYKSGVITNLDLLTAQTNLQDAELGKIQLEFNILLSRLTLNQIGGVKIWK